MTYERSVGLTPDARFDALAEIEGRPRVRALELIFRRKSRPDEASTTRETRARVACVILRVTLHRPSVFTSRRHDVDE